MSRSAQGSGTRLGHGEPQLSCRHFGRSSASLCCHLCELAFSALGSATKLKSRPESPRWLVAQGRIEDAHATVARVNARGDKTDPIVIAEFQKIVDALQTDKAVAAQAMSPKELIRTPTARRRLAIGASPGLFSCIAGNIIASYYLGQSLTGAGITDRNDQLKAVSL